jgi:hypothetical protein
MCGHKTHLNPAAEGYQDAHDGRGIARLFEEALPTDISVAVETALDLKSCLACLGAIGIGTKAALLLGHESSRHRGGNYGHHEYEHSSPPDFEPPPVIV